MRSFSRTIVASVAVLAGCGAGATNLERVEAEIYEVAEAMDVPADLLPLDDLEPVAEMARVNGWGDVSFHDGRVQLDDGGKVACLTLPGPRNGKRTVSDGPCA